ncbi:hypothetical protein [Microbacterium karelineae]|uniref:hypothetical protein n=1 Tax=Microbacterium karelineae TaxID=2654283 RepID=UPI0012EA991B|nr:hypothetical protein [Microbacterium karelineae]
MFELPEIAPEDLLAWAVPALVVFGAAALVVVAIVLVVRVARRGKGARRRAREALDSLGVRLVELDDQTEELELEIGMSSALYDGRPPASLRRARLTAQHTRDDAFAAYRDAADEGMLPSAQRREAKRLTAGIDKAMEVIRGARADNEEWLREHASADEQIDVARRRIDELETRMGDPGALRAELDRIADESEWEDAAQADDEARAAIDEAREHLRDAEDRAADPSRSARESLRACEKALSRAEQASRLLEETHRLVKNAYLAVDDERRAAESAIRAAIGTQKTLDAEHAPRLAEAIRVAGVALESAGEIAGRRPVTANERIARLRDRLDMALADARTQQQRLRGARSALPGSLNAARSALARAEAVILDAEVDARVRLDSARRELAFARQAHDPIEALDASRRARRDAEDAAVLARFRKRRR